MLNETFSVIFKHRVSVSGHRLVIWELILKTLLGSSNGVTTWCPSNYRLSSAFKTNYFYLKYRTEFFFLPPSGKIDCNRNNSWTITKPIQISGILASQTNLENLEKLDLYNISTKCWLQYRKNFIMKMVFWSLKAYLIQKNLIILLRNMNNYLR